MLTLRVRLVVKPDTLTDLTNQMTEKVGLVHGLPYVADRQGFAATLEQVRLHANIMLSLLTWYNDWNHSNDLMKKTLVKIRHDVVRLNFKDFLSSWLIMAILKVFQYLMFFHPHNLSSLSTLRKPCWILTHDNFCTVCAKSSFLMITLLLHLCKRDGDGVFFYLCWCYQMLTLFL